MNEERAKAVVDPCRLKLGKGASASLEYRIALEIRAAQREELVRILARLDYGMIEANWNGSFGPLPKFDETVSGITTALREGIRALIEELGKE